MKSLITGASGYIGLEVLKCVRERNGDARALVRPGTDTARMTPLTDDVAYADLSRKFDGREALDGIECIYHLAAGTSGSHYELMMNTVVATDNLMKALSPGSLKRFVLVSSFSVYQMSAIKTRGVLDEKSPVETNLQARDSYAVAKIRQERLVIKACAEKGIPLVIVRPGKIYGPGTNPLLPQLGLRIPGACFLYIGGRNVLPLTHVSNCAEAVARAGFAEGCEGEVINVVDDDLPNQAQYLKELQGRMGKIRRKVWVPFPVFRTMAYTLEIASKKTNGNVPAVVTRYRAENLWKNLRYTNGKAKALLGWRPRISTERGLIEMFESPMTPGIPGP